MTVAVSDPATPDDRPDWSLETHPGAWKPVVMAGLLFAFAALYVTLVGIVTTFEDRDIIEDVITLGAGILLLTFAFAGYVGARRAPAGPLNAIIGAAVTGLMAGGALSILLIIGPALGLRGYLPNAWPRPVQPHLGRGSAGRGERTRHVARRRLSHHALVPRPRGHERGHPRRPPEPATQASAEPGHPGRGRGHRDGHVREHHPLAHAPARGLLGRGARALLLEWPAHAGRVPGGQPGRSWPTSRGLSSGPTSAGVPCPRRPAATDG